MSGRRHRRNVHRESIPAAVLHACEPLEARTLLSTIVIQAVGQDAQVTLSSHVSFRPAPLHFVDYKAFAGDTTHSLLVNAFDTVLVKNAPGDRMTVNVLSTYVSATLQYDGSGGIFGATANLGGGPNGMQHLVAPVTLTEPTPDVFSVQWTVNADDSADTTSHTFSLTSGGNGTLTGLAPTDITWTTPAHSIQIDTSSAGGNILNIPSEDHAPTTLVGHSTGADDTLNIGSDASQGLAGLGGSDFVTLHPSATFSTGSGGRVPV